MKKKVLILSGPTHEYIDPVRFIGNASSGKMGRALAEEALRCGMEVEFISGPVPTIHLPSAVRITFVTSAEEMLSVAREKVAAADRIVFAAAIADFQPIEKSTLKIPKTGTPITIEFKPTPDIAATLCASKRSNQIAIGFALQTHNGEAKAREKLISKNLDGIVLNTPASLGTESGQFVWISEKLCENWGSLTKVECAKRIFEKCPILIE